MRAVARIVAGLAVLGAVVTGGATAFAASATEYGLLSAQPNASATEYGVAQPDATAVEYGLLVAQPDASATEY
jgi:hypothetical protein